MPLPEKYLATNYKKVLLFFEGGAAPSNSPGRGLSPLHPAYVFRRFAAEK
jgi:hypothetical protein